MKYLTLLKHFSNSSICFVKINKKCLAKKEPLCGPLKCPNPPHPRIQVLKTFCKYNFNKKPMQKPKRYVPDNDNPDCPYCKRRK